MVLPHPETLGATPPAFVALYMPGDVQKQHYAIMPAWQCKQVIVKWDGKPHKFKNFLIAMKPAAANTSPDFVRCIENKVYANSM